MVREFYIENEKGQQFSMMDIENCCFLNTPNGLGYSYNTEYAQIGNNFIQNIRKLVQGNISGELIFKKYSNYKTFIDFIESADNLKFVYKIPSSNVFKVFYKDIDISSIEKTEIGTDGLLRCPAEFNIKSLWYEQQETIIYIESSSNEIRWNFDWDSAFSDYDNRNIIFENKGHTEAPIKLELDGEIVDPTISVLVNEEVKYQLDLAGLTIQENEKLLYCTKDTDLYIYKQTSSGTLVNLFNTLNLNNTNFFKLPVRS